MTRISSRIGSVVAAVVLLATLLALPAAATAVPPLTGVRSLASGGLSTCGVLTSGKVDCWGRGDSGQLGDGTFYRSANEGPAAPVAVKGIGGAGTLGGVASLSSDEDSATYCALLTSGRVDCWGDGIFGQLGNGTFYSASPYGSAVPVAVKGVGGVGTLGGVAGLTSTESGYCARLTSGEVDCWGYGSLGALGDGTSPTTGHKGSAVPVAVKGAGGVGTLRGVAGLTSDDSGYCARLTSTDIDCWGYGGDGELGDGRFANSNLPVPVIRTSGRDALRGVAGLTSATVSATGVGGYCAVLTSGKVDCWGAGQLDQLGNGKSYSSSPGGSSVPVTVKGVGGVGSLSGVASLTSDDIGYCALLTSGKVDCWGSGSNGELGNGTFANVGSAVPVAVKGVGATGTLGGVASLTADAGNSDSADFCARLTSGNADCWGYGIVGELGDGVFYTSGNDGSAVPVAVTGLGGTGALGGVASLTSHGDGSCALLTSTRVDCWGGGWLGNGMFYTSGNYGSAVPVAVIR